MEATVFAIEASAGWVDEGPIGVDEDGCVEKSAASTSL